MIVFINEDRAYLSWVNHHRHGYVMEMLRKPTRKPPVVHRATCEKTKSSKSKETHWTTGRHIKACSLGIDELLAWAKTEAMSEPINCVECKPTEGDTSHADQERRLTKLGKDIVDYVVEAAVISLDQHTPYDVTVGAAAAYLNKTPAQISSALLRLVEDGYLRTHGKISAKQASSKVVELYPTANALRTLPAFEHMSERKVGKELEQLSDGES